MNNYILRASIVILFIGIVSFSVFMENTIPLKKPAVYYVPPSEFIKFISGTFNLFWADVFYIRGVMSITGKFKDREERTYWVQQNFKLATDLDPELLQSYFFGGVVMGQTKETIKMCIRFLKYALSKKSDDWHLYYWIGFNCYELGDYSSAIKYYKKASQFPDSPDYLKSNQPMLYYQAGRLDLGIAYLKGLISSIKDTKQLKWVRVKLRWLENIAKLERAVKEFNQIYHRMPDDLGELVEKGVIKEIPQDPFLGGYYLDKKSGRVKSKPRMVLQRVK